MDIDQYNEEQRGLTAALIRLIFYVFRPFRARALSRQQWTQLLAIIYPEVENYRRQSADLGRQLFDAEREKYVGARRDAWLAHYEFPWFVNAMEPARKAMSEPGADDSAISQVALRAAKEVENGGRRTILRAVEEDPVVRGWARVATGRETCAFCMMLVSRGPVYTSADTAGLDLNDTSAEDLWHKAEEGDLESRQVIDELMTRWHPGCDCKVVPVYKISEWPGRDAWKRAEDAWKKYTKGYSGLDALNALRRAVDSGQLDLRDFAVAA